MIKYLILLCFLTSCVTVEEEDPRAHACENSCKELDGFDHYDSEVDLCFCNFSEASNKGISNEFFN